MVDQAGLCTQKKVDLMLKRGHGRGPDGESVGDNLIVSPRLSLLLSFGTENGAQVFDPSFDKYEYNKCPFGHYYQWLY